jgi:hypothetical protein
MKPSLNKSLSASRHLVFDTFSLKPSDGTIGTNRYEEAALRLTEPSSTVTFTGGRLRQAADEYPEMETAGSPTSINADTYSPFAPAASESNSINPITSYRKDLLYWVMELGPLEKQHEELKSMAPDGSNLPLDIGKIIPGYFYRALPIPPESTV